MHTAYITHQVCLKHDMGEDHPECPARMHAVEDQLIASGLLPFLERHDAPLVTREQLLRVHDPAYVEQIFLRAPTDGMVHLDPDTAMNPDSLEAALRASGAAVMATDLVISGQVENAFCNIRPPGHHARRGNSGGFCIFNNVAVGVAHALEHHGLQRVAIADFDVHHGDGTEDIFRDESRVMLCSTSSMSRCQAEPEATNFEPQYLKNGYRRWSAFSLKCCSFRQDLTRTGRMTWEGLDWLIPITDG